MSTTEKLIAVGIGAFLILVVVASCNSIIECNKAGGSWHRGACFSKDIIIR